VLFIWVGTLTKAKILRQIENGKANIQNLQKLSVANEFR
jgi:hypothetical protein